MKASYPTSDSQCLHELPMFFFFFFFFFFFAFLSKILVAMRFFWVLIVGPFLHEKFLFLSS